MADLDPFDSSLAEFSAKFPNGDVEPLTYSGGRMIVRTPDDGTYARFLTESDDATKRHAATVNLCRQCILSPDLATVDALFRRKPGLVHAIGAKLLTKAGVGEEITLGK